MEREHGLPTSAHWDAYWEEQSRTGYISAPAEVWNVLRSTVEVSGLNVLDLATGTGGTAIRLAAAGADVTVIDLSLRSLALATETARTQGATLAPVCADVLHLPIPDRMFDLVTSLGVMHYFQDPGTFLDELYRVTRPGGLTLVEVPQKYSLFTIHKRLLMARGRWTYGDWETEYSLEALCNLLRAHGFEPARSYGREFYPRLYYMVRHMQKIDQRLGRPTLPKTWWLKYEQIWQHLEHGWWGLHTLRDVGVLARKPADG